MRVGLIAALLAVSLAAVAGLHMASAGGDKSPPSRRPNIVFFLCDDLGTGDLACPGVPGHEDTQHRRPLRPGHAALAVLGGQFRLRPEPLRAADG